MNSATCGHGKPPNSETMADNIREYLFGDKSMEMGLCAIHTNTIMWSNKNVLDFSITCGHAGTIKCELSLPAWP